MPILLQKEDDQWLYGGPYFILSLMHGEGKKLVDEGLREVEQISSRKSCNALLFCLVCSILLALRNAVLGVTFNNPRKKACCLEYF